MLYVGTVLFFVCLVGTPISILVLIIRALLKKKIGKNAVTAILFFAGFVTGVIMILRSPDIEETESVSAIDTGENDKYSDQSEEELYNIEEDVSADVEDDYIENAEDYTNEDDDLYGEDEVVWDDFEDNLNNDIDVDIENIVFSVPTYPYQNKKEARKLMKTYEKAMKAPITDFIGVEEVSEGGIVSAKEIHYKKTVDTRKAAYRYFGKTNKAGEPEGIGILFTTWSVEWQESGNVSTSICYIGNFKDGFKDGYGIEYWEYSGKYLVDYEGEFKKGKYNGEGIDYLSEVSVSYDSITEMREKIYSQTEGNTVKVEPICLSLKYYEGEFKEGEYDGKGKAYWSVVDNKEILTYEGEFEAGTFNGEGTSYFNNGNIQYKGKFKNGYYSGKGTLYDEQGNIVHKGKFKNGDIE